MLGRPSPGILGPSATMMLAEAVLEVVDILRTAAGSRNQKSRGLDGWERIVREIASKGHLTGDEAERIERAIGFERRRTEDRVRLAAERVAVTTAVTQVRALFVAGSIEET